MRRTVTIEAGVEVDLDNVLNNAELKDILKSLKVKNYYDEEEVINVLIEVLKLDIIKIQKLKDFVKQLKQE